MKQHTEQVRTAAGNKLKGLKISHRIYNGKKHVVMSSVIMLKLAHKTTVFLPGKNCLFCLHIGVNRP